MKSKQDYPLVMKVEHVMEILGIGKRVAYELMDRTDFPCTKIGKLKRVNREAFFEWLEGTSKVS